MRVKSVFLAAASAAGLMIAGPALAQDSGGPVESLLLGSDDNVIINDLLDVFTLTASSSTSESSFDDNDITVVEATQVLTAVNTNSNMNALIDMPALLTGGYNSGDNSVGDNAYAAFAGISNAAWNTGVNANSQAATNIAARGTVTFGVD
jgi:hypothetical protein